MSGSDELLNELKKQTAAINDLKETIISIAGTISYQMGMIAGKIDNLRGDFQEDEDDGLTPSNQYLDGRNVET